MSNSSAFSRCICIRVVLQAPQNPSLSAPIFVRECQRWLPVASRSVLQATKEERKAERRKTLIRILRTCVRLALCKGRSPVGVPPRLLPEGLFIPKAQLGPGFVRGTPRGGFSADIVPHFQRCTSRAGHSAGRLMPKLPGSGGDEPPRAGTAPALHQPGSPANVLSRQAGLSSFNLLQQ